MEEAAAKDRGTRKLKGGERARLRVPAEEEGTEDLSVSMPTNDLFDRNEYRPCAEENTQQ